MKKILLLFLVLISLLMTVNSAFAHYRRYPYYSHCYSGCSRYIVGRDFVQNEHAFPDCENHSLLSQTTIYYYSDGTSTSFTSYSILNSDGAVLDADCADVRHAVYNKEHFFIVKKNKKYKILSGEGVLVSRRNYTNMTEIAPNKLLVRAEKKWGIVDFSDNTIVPLKYKSFKQIGAELFITELNGYYGIVDASNNTLVKNEFDKISPLYETYLLKKYKKYGLADMGGKVILAPDYDKIKKLGEYILVKKSGKYGLLDGTGKTICDVKYKKIRLERNNIEVLLDKDWQSLDTGL